MKPQTDIKIYRTRNDTDAISFILSYSEDGCVARVPDIATVNLNIETSPVIQITGSGEGSGEFVFPTTSLSGIDGTYNFEVEVNDTTKIYTIGTGSLIIYPDIA